jgi:hypothetical protein
VDRRGSTELLTQTSHAPARARDKPAPSLTAAGIGPPNLGSVAAGGRIASPSAGSGSHLASRATGGPGVSPHRGALGPIARGGTRTDPNPGIVQWDQRVAGNSAACPYRDNRAGGARAAVD